VKPLDENEIQPLLLLAAREKIGQVEIFEEALFGSAVNGCVTFEIGPGASAEGFDGGSGLAAGTVEGRAGGGEEGGAAIFEGGAFVGGGGDWGGGAVGAVLGVVGYGLWFGGAHYFGKEILFGGEDVFCFLDMW